MFVHTVLFHLKKNLLEEEINFFHSGLKELKKIKVNKATYIGTPASTSDRDLVISNYSFNLTIIFEDINGHNSYQEDKIHKNFINKFSKYWTKIEIIDAD